MNKSNLSLLAILISMSVVLNSAHAKELALVSKQDDQHVVKLAGELHNHIDKTGKSLLKVVSDGSQVDARSLRLREHKKRSHSLARWLARYNPLALYIQA